MVTGRKRKHKPEASCEDCLVCTYLEVLSHDTVIGGVAYTLCQQRQSPGLLWCLWMLLKSLVLCWSDDFCFVLNKGIRYNFISQQEIFQSLLLQVFFLRLQINQTVHHRVTKSHLVHSLCLWLYSVSSDLTESVSRHKLLAAHSTGKSQVSDEKITGHEWPAHV